MKNHNFGILLKTLCFMCLFLIACPVWAVIHFDNLDLNAKNTLLFSASAATPWVPQYDALFTASCDGTNVRILSCFPEAMELLEEGKTLQIRNWFGTARFSAENNAIKWTSRTPIFENGKPLSYNPPAVMQVSPNGKYTAVLRKTSPAYAELLLIDEENSIQTVIAANVPFDTKVVPVKWAYDSSFFVYQNQGKILFAQPNMFFESARIGEQFRTLGEGTINNVYWCENGDLIIAQGKDLFALPKTELYTRSLYANVVGSGKRIGSLPAIFDNKRDSFWFDKTGKAVLYVQNNSNLWLLQIDSGANGKNAFVAPFVSLPNQVSSVQVFWTSENLPIIWATQLLNGRTNAIAFKMNRTVLANGSSTYGVSALALPQNAGMPKISPNGEKIAFTSDEGLFVYNCKNWQSVEVYKEEKVHTYLWANDTALFVGGWQTIRSWNISTKVQHVLFLSSAQNFGWNASGQNVLAEVAGKTLVFNQSTGLWHISGEKLNPKRNVQNESVRVFIDDSKNGYFENAIYVRYVAENTFTKPLFIEPAATETGAYKAQKPKVALCFEALDNDDGLTDILATLQDNGVKATFFINGEFIRRFPTGVQEIVAGGHQCGSMFFSTIDLLSPNYNIDEAFILQGLARNEDEFFDLTGKDMSLIWHTPDYISNSMINTAGAKAGYTFVMPNIAPADWVTSETAVRVPGMYKSSAELVEQTVKQLKPGCTITLQVGLSKGKRPDYVYEYLDSLINEILSQGYEITTYSHR